MVITKVIWARLRDASAAYDLEVTGAAIEIMTLEIVEAAVAREKTVVEIVRPTEGTEAIVTIETASIRGYHLAGMNPQRHMVGGQVLLEDTAQGETTLPVRATGTNLLADSNMLGIITTKATIDNGGYE